MGNPPTGDQAIPTHTVFGPVRRQETDRCERRTPLFVSVPSLTTPLHACASNRTYEGNAFAEDHAAPDHALHNLVKRHVTDRCEQRSRRYTDSASDTAQTFTRGSKIAHGTATNDAEVSLPKEDTQVPGSAVHGWQPVHSVVERPETDRCDRHENTAALSVALRVGGAHERAALLHRRLRLASEEQQQQQVKARQERMLLDKENAAQMAHSLQCCRDVLASSPDFQDPSTLSGLDKSIKIHHLLAGEQSNQVQVHLLGETQGPVGVLVRQPGEPPALPLPARQEKQRRPGQRCKRPESVIAAHRAVREADSDELEPRLEEWQRAKEEALHRRLAEAARERAEECPSPPPGPPERDDDDSETAGAEIASHGEVTPAAPEKPIAVPDPHDRQWTCTLSTVKSAAEHLRDVPAGDDVTAAMTKLAAFNQLLEEMQEAGQPCPPPGYLHSLTLNVLTSCEELGVLLAGEGARQHVMVAKDLLQQRRLGFHELALYYYQMLYAYVRNSGDTAAAILFVKSHSSKYQSGHNRHEQAQRLLQKKIREAHKMAPDDDSTPRWREVSKVLVHIFLCKGSREDHRLAEKDHVVQIDPSCLPQLKCKPGGSSMAAVQGAVPVGGPGLASSSDVRPSTTPGEATAHRTATRPSWADGEAQSATGVATGDSMPGATEEAAVAPQQHGLPAGHTAAAGLAVPTRYSPGYPMHFRIAGHLFPTTFTEGETFAGLYARLLPMLKRRKIAWNAPEGVTVHISRHYQDPEGKSCSALTWLCDSSTEPPCIWESAVSQWAYPGSTIQCMEFQPIPEGAVHSRPQAPDYYLALQCPSSAPTSDIASVQGQLHANQLAAAAGLNAALIHKAQETLSNDSLRVLYDVLWRCGVQLDTGRALTVEPVLLDTTRSPWPVMPGWGANGAPLAPRCALEYIATQLSSNTVTWFAPHEWLVPSGNAQANATASLAKAVAFLGGLSRATADDHLHSEMFCGHVDGNARDWVVELVANPMEGGGSAKGKAHGKGAGDGKGQSTSDGKGAGRGGRAAAGGVLMTAVCKHPLGAAALCRLMLHDDHRSNALVLCTGLGSRTTVRLGWGPYTQQGGLRQQFRLPSHPSEAASQSNGGITGMLAASGYGTTTDPGHFRCPLQRREWSLTPGRSMESNTSQELRLRQEYASDGRLTVAATLQVADACSYNVVKLLQQAGNVLPAAASTARKQKLVELHYAAGRAADIIHAGTLPTDALLTATERTTSLSRKGASVVDIVGLDQQAARDQFHKTWHARYAEQVALGVNHKHLLLPGPSYYAAQLVAADCLPLLAFVCYSKSMMHVVYAKTMEGAAEAALRHVSLPMHAEALYRHVCLGQRLDRLHVLPSDHREWKMPTTGQWTEDGFKAHPPELLRPSQPAAKRKAEDAAQAPAKGRGSAPSRAADASMAEVQDAAAASSQESGEAAATAAGETAPAQEAVVLTEPVVASAAPRPADTPTSAPADSESEHEIELFAPASPVPDVWAEVPYLGVAEVRKGVTIALEGDQRVALERYAGYVVTGEDGLQGVLQRASVGGAPRLLLLVGWSETFGEPEHWSVLLLHTAGGAGSSHAVRGCHELPGGPRSVASQPSYVRALTQYGYTVVMHELPQPDHPSRRAYHALQWAAQAMHHTADLMLLPTVVGWSMEWDDCYSHWSVQLQRPVAQAAVGTAPVSARVTEALCQAMRAEEAAALAVHLDQSIGLRQPAASTPADQAERELRRVWRSGMCALASILLAQNRSPHFRDLPPGSELRALKLKNLAALPPATQQQLPTDVQLDQLPAWDGTARVGPGGVSVIRWLRENVEATRALWQKQVGWNGIRRVLKVLNIHCVVTCGEGEAAATYFVDANDLQDTALLQSDRRVWIALHRSDSEHLEPRFLYDQTGAELELPTFAELVHSLASQRYGRPTRGVPYNYHKETYGMESTTAAPTAVASASDSALPGAPPVEAPSEMPPAEPERPPRNSVPFRLLPMSAEDLQEWRYGNQYGRLNPTSVEREADVWRTCSPATEALVHGPLWLQADYNANRQGQPLPQPFDVHADALAAFAGPGDSVLVEDESPALSDVEWVVVEDGDRARREHCMATQLERDALQQDGCSVVGFGTTDGARQRAATHVVAVEIARSAGLEWCAVVYATADPSPLPLVEWMARRCRIHILTPAEQEGLQEGDSVHEVISFGDGVAAAQRARVYAKLLWRHAGQQPEYEHDGTCANHLDDAAWLQRMAARYGGWGQRAPLLQFSDSAWSGRIAALDGGLPPVVMQMANTLADRYLDGGPPPRPADVLVYLQDLPGNESATLAARKWVQHVSERALRYGHEAAESGDRLRVAARTLHLIVTQVISVQQCRRPRPPPRWYAMNARNWYAMDARNWYETVFLTTEEQLERGTMAMVRRRAPETYIHQHVSDGRHGCVEQPEPLLELRHAHLLLAHLMLSQPHQWSDASQERLDGTPVTEATWLRAESWRTVCFAPPAAGREYWAEAADNMGYELDARAAQRLHRIFNNGGLIRVVAVVPTGILLASQHGARGGDEISLRPYGGQEWPGPAEERVFMHLTMHGEPLRPDIAKFLHENEWTMLEPPTWPSNWQRPGPAARIWHYLRAVQVLTADAGLTMKGLNAPASYLQSIDLTAGLDSRSIELLGRARMAMHISMAGMQPSKIPGEFKADRLLLNGLPRRFPQDPAVTPNDSIAAMHTTTFGETSQQEPPRDTVPGPAGLLRRARELRSGRCLTARGRRLVTRSRFDELGSVSSSVTDALQNALQTYAQEAGRCMRLGEAVPPPEGMQLWLDVLRAITADAQEQDERLRTTWAVCDAMYNGGRTMGYLGRPSNAGAEHQAGTRQDPSAMPWGLGTWEDAPPPMWNREPAGPPGITTWGRHVPTTTHPMEQYSIDDHEIMEVKAKLAKEIELHGLHPSWRRCAAIVAKTAPESVCPFPPEPHFIRAIHARTPEGGGSGGTPNEEESAGPDCPRAALQLEKIHGDFIENEHSAARLGEIQEFLQLRVYDDSGRPLHRKALSTLKGVEDARNVDVLLVMLSCISERPLEEVARCDAMHHIARWIKAAIGLNADASITLFDLDKILVLFGIGAFLIDADRRSVIVMGERPINYQPWNKYNGHTGEELAYLVMGYRVLDREACTRLGSAQMLADAQSRHNTEVPWGPWQESHMREKNWVQPGGRLLPFQIAQARALRTQEEAMCIVQHTCPPVRRFESGCNIKDMTTLCELLADRPAYRPWMEQVLQCSFGANHPPEVSREEPLHMAARPRPSLPMHRSDPRATAFAASLRNLAVFRDVYLKPKDVLDYDPELGLTREEFDPDQDVDYSGPHPLHGAYPLCAPAAILVQTQRDATEPGALDALLRQGGEALQLKKRVGLGALALTSTMHLSRMAHLRHTNLVIVGLTPPALNPYVYLVPGAVEADNVIFLVEELVQHGTRWMWHLMPHPYLKGRFTFQEAMWASTQVVLHDRGPDFRAAIPHLVGTEELREWSQELSAGGAPAPDVYHRPLRTAIEKATLPNHAYGAPKSAGAKPPGIPTGGAVQSATPASQGHTPAPAGGAGQSAAPAPPGRAPAPAPALTGHDANASASPPVHAAAACGAGAPDGGADQPSHAVPASAAGREGDTGDSLVTGVPWRLAVSLGDACSAATGGNVGQAAPLPSTVASPQTDAHARASLLSAGGADAAGWQTRLSDVDMGARSLRLAVRHGNMTDRQRMFQRTDDPGVWRWKSQRKLDRLVTGYASGGTLPPRTKEHEEQVASVVSLLLRAWGEVLIRQRSRAIAVSMLLISNLKIKFRILAQAYARRHTLIWARISRDRLRRESESLGVGPEFRSAAVLAVPPLIGCAGESGREAGGAAHAPPAESLGLRACLRALQNERPQGQPQATPSTRPQASLYALAPPRPAQGLLGGSAGASLGVGHGGVAASGVAAPPAPEGLTSHASSGGEASGLTLPISGLPLPRWEQQLSTLAHAVSGIQTAVEQLTAQAPRVRQETLRSVQEMNDVNVARCNDLLQTQVPRMVASILQSAREDGRLGERDDFRTPRRMAAHAGDLEPSDGLESRRAAAKQTLRDARPGLGDLAQTPRGRNHPEPVSASSREPRRSGSLLALLYHDAVTLEDAPVVLTGEKMQELTYSRSTITQMVDAIAESLITVEVPEHCTLSRAGLVVRNTVSSLPLAEKLAPDNLSVKVMDMPPGLSLSSGGTENVRFLALVQRDFLESSPADTAYLMGTEEHVGHVDTPVQDLHHRLAGLAPHSPWEPARAALVEQLRLLLRQGRHGTADEGRRDNRDYDTSYYDTSRDRGAPKVDLGKMPVRQIINAYKPWTNQWPSVAAYMYYIVGETVRGAESVLRYVATQQDGMSMLLRALVHQLVTSEYGSGMCNALNNITVQTQLDELGRTMDAKVRTRGLAPTRKPTEDILEDLCEWQCMMYSHLRALITFRSVPELLKTETALTMGRERDDPRWQTDLQWLKVMFQALHMLMRLLGSMVTDAISQTELLDYLPAVARGIRDQALQFKLYQLAEDYIKDAARRYGVTQSALTSELRERVFSPARTERAQGQPGHQMLMESMQASLTTTLLSSVTQPVTINRPEDLRLINGLDLTGFSKLAEHHLVHAHAQIRAVTQTEVTGARLEVFAVGSSELGEPAAHPLEIMLLDPRIGAVPSRGAGSTQAVCQVQAAAGTAPTPDSVRANVDEGLSRSLAAIAEFETRISQRLEEHALDTRALLDSERAERAAEARLNHRQIDVIAKETELGKLPSLDANLAACAPEAAAPANVYAVDERQSHLRFDQSRSGGRNGGGGARFDSSQRNGGGSFRSGGGGTPQPGLRTGGGVPELTKPHLADIRPSRVRRDRDGRVAMRLLDKPQIAYAEFPERIKDPLLSSMGITAANWPEHAKKPCGLCDVDGNANHLMGNCVYLFLTTEKGRSTLGEERAESAKQLLRSSKPQVVREARAQGMTATVAVCELCGLDSDDELADAYGICAVAARIDGLLETHERRR